MDSFTQVVLGAAAGERAAGRRLGRRALAWGALAGTIPDLDVLAAPFLSEPAALRFHRGPTHSLFFAFVAAPLLGMLVAALYRRRPPDPLAPGLHSRRAWTWLFFWGLWTHPLLDLFTNYGTQLFWPLSRHPFALASVFIIDPFYTLPLLGAVLVAWRWRAEAARRARAVGWGLALSTLYLGWGLGVQAYVRHEARQALSTRGLGASAMLVEPTAFSSLLWTILVRDDARPDRAGFYASTFSLLDPRPARFGWVAVPEARALARPFDNTEALRTLDWFSQGWLHFSAEPSGDVTACDLRFGRTDAFLTPGAAPCIFTFALTRTPDGATFVQQRPALDVKAALSSLARRSGGQRPAWYLRPPPDSL